MYGWCVCVCVCVGCAGASDEWTRRMRLFASARFLANLLCIDGHLNVFKFLANLKITSYDVTCVKYALNVMIFSGLVLYS